MKNPLADKTVGFIGGGRITRILLDGRSRAGSWPARLLVSDTDDAALAKIKRRFPNFDVLPNGNIKAAEQDYVFLALPPAAIPEVAEQIRPSLRPDAIAISLAPKVTILTLAGLLGGFKRIVRCIPNAPAMVNLGFNPLAFSPALSDLDKLAVADLFVAWGCCPQVLEDKLEAYAVLTALGPAYFWFQLYELRRLGQSFGLTAAEAQLGLDRLCIGLLKMMADSGLSAEEVMGLIPANPLGEMEAPLLEAYRTRLGAVMRQIRP